ncbi:Zinc finger, SWIM-type [Phytophthora cactorum]|nr:Zinc finger, SWIM-type [Phytophthora cactorum]
MEAASFKRRSKNSMMWEVYWANQTFQCDDVEWTCNCLFYKSNHLPCRHLMFVAHNGHGFQELPAISVDERWNTLKR